jgi:hypothetical protein
MRIALPPMLGPAAAIAGTSLCLFGFGFLAGLTVNAPWGTGPAAICGVATVLAAGIPLAWLRRQGTQAATGAGETWLARLDPPFAYGIAVALALAATGLIVACPAWTGAALFWSACFGLMSAGFTVFGDARSRAESGAADTDGPSDDVPEEDLHDGGAPHPILA